ncbi:MAG: efflux RND transporter periplasmic adaptor subunit, partial [candidate division KSB1 bacterium]|nr:efflux RND transporter periplasmic adaptor subunit [candidate division KSB1 bacterium]
MNLNGIRKYFETKRNRYFFPLLAGLTIIVTVTLLLGIGNNSVETQWAQVKRGNFVVDLTESGEINAVNSVMVKAPMEWRMDLQIIDMVSEGTQVEKEDFLLQFDVSTLESKLAEAKDQLNYHLADLERLKADQASRISQLESDTTMAQFSQKQAQLQLELLKFESETRKEDARLSLKKAELQLEEARTRLQAQKIMDQVEREKIQLQINQARAEVQEIQSKIEEFTIQAPISGLVVYNEIGDWQSRKKPKIGDKVNPGVGIIQIPDLSKMELRCWVNEADAAKVEIGQKAIIQLEAFEEPLFHGQVVEKARLAQKEGEASNVKNFEVRVAIAEFDPKLKPGMTARCQIILKEIPRALFVPLGTVYESEIPHQAEVVFPQKSWPKPVSVKLGERNDDSVIIKEGLAEGEKIARKAPAGRIHKLGWAEEQRKKALETKSLAEHFKLMEQRGLAFDYGAYRQRLADTAIIKTKPPTGSAGAQKMMGQFKVLEGQEGAAKVTPKMLKSTGYMVASLQPSAYSRDPSELVKKSLGEMSEGREQCSRPQDLGCFAAAPSLRGGALLHP